MPHAEKSHILRKVYKEPMINTTTLQD